MPASVHGDRLYEDAACGLVLTATDGTIVRTNRTFQSWIGRTGEALAGVRLQSLLTIGSRIFHQTHWAPLLKMQGSLSEVKLEILHADGSKLPIVMNAVVRQHAGVDHHELALFSARDRHQYERELLKARQAAEQHLARELASQKKLADAQARLELAIGAAQLLPWTIELPGRRRLYAAQVGRLWGRDPGEELEADEFLERLHPDDRDAEQAALDAFLDRGEGRFEFTFRLFGAEREERWVTAWGQFRQGPGGVPIAVVGVLQDVTEAHRQRALAVDRALLAEQTLAIVGHDLRNPLAAIQLSADALALGRLGPEQQRNVVDRIRSSTRRAHRLIADLLDFTQARIGKELRLVRTAVDIHAIAAEVVAELSIAHPKCVLRHRARGDGRCQADPDRLIQALGNLVSNAVTYGEPGGVVSVSSVGSADRARFEVHNHGPAIAPASMASLFEPMSRGEAPGQLRSIGLGLYIVRKIAHAHGGEVDCRSDAVEGTTFVIDIPG